ncbi:MAG TPA: hypothetical protein VHB99_20160 [Pirellulales bacterium]|nr:hypothetical protein [Pirellulales bacterium]
MYKSLVLAAAMLAVLVGAKLGLADDPSFRADRKITGEYFRPHTAGAYHQNAISHAETLGFYGERYNEVPYETTQEHAVEIHRNLTAAKQEFSKLGDEAKRNPKIAEHLKAIQQHHARATELARQLDDETADAQSIAERSAQIADELNAAEEENEKLKQTLGAQN